RGDARMPEGDHAALAGEEVDARGEDPGDEHGGGERYDEAGDPQVRQRDADDQDEPEEVECQGAAASARHANGADRARLDDAVAHAFAFPKSPVGRSTRTSAIGRKIVKYASSGIHALANASMRPMRTLPTAAPA